MLFLLSTVAMASGWLEDPGRLRLGLSTVATTTTRQFAPGDAPGFVGDLCPTPIQPGQPMPFSCETGGRFTSLGLYMSAAVGLHRHLSLDLDLPVVPYAAFADDIETNRVHGLGDLRFGLRTGGHLGPLSLVGALHLGLPTGVNDLGERDIPIGEGHLDLEPGLRAGIGTRWGWVESRQTFRLRFPTPRLNVRLGHEYLGTLTGGVTPHEQLALTLGADWLLATADRDTFGLASPGRQYLQAHVGVAYKRSDVLWVGLDFGIPVAGRRWPTGVVYALSLSGRLRLTRESPSRRRQKSPRSARGSDAARPGGDSPHRLLASP